MLFELFSIINITNITDQKIMVWEEQNLKVVFSLVPLFNITFGWVQNFLMLEKLLITKTLFLIFLWPRVGHTCSKNQRIVKICLTLISLNYCICKKESSFPNSFFEVTGLLPNTTLLVKKYKLILNKLIYVNRNKA